MDAACFYLIILSDVCLFSQFFIIINNTEMSILVDKPFIGSLMVSLDKFLEEKLQGQKHKYLSDSCSILPSCFPEQSCQCLLAAGLSAHGMPTPLHCSPPSSSLLNSTANSQYLPYLSVAFDIIDTLILICFFP